MSTVKKLLLSLMVIGAVGTTVSAGTFASFTGTTTNTASTFASGTIVLSDTVGSGTACLSNGGATGDASVDAANDNDNCDLLFDGWDAIDSNARYKRPGEKGSVAVHLKNEGNIAGTLTVRSEADCSSMKADESAPGVPEPGMYDGPFPYGTTDTCDFVQLSIEDGTTCYWGDNMTTVGQKPYITSAPLTFPLTISASANRFRLTTQSTARGNFTITAGAYASAGALATHIQTLIGTWTDVTAVGSSIRITSKATTGNLQVGIPTVTTSTSGIAAIGFMDGSTAAGPGQCAVKTGDRDHTLADFRTTTLTTPLASGSILPGVTRDFTVTMSVPALPSTPVLTPGLWDQTQSRRNLFELTWQLTA